MLAKTNYAASKAGLIGLTKSLARELASAISLLTQWRWVCYYGHAFRASDKVKNTIHAKIPLGRTGTPDEIASAVAFLASQKRATSLAGAVRRWRNRDVMFVLECGDMSPL